MKKLLLTLVLLVGIIFGALAQKLTYQAAIRDNSHRLVTNTAVKATVTITFTTGTPATYSEEVNGTTNLHGLLSIEFGDETLLGRDWTDATIAVRVVNADDESTVYVGGDARPVSAVPYALSVNGTAIQQYLTEHHYVDQTELDSRHYLRSDSAVITTMQNDIVDLKAGQLDCDKVKDCIKDTLSKYTPTADLTGLLQQLAARLDAQDAKMDSLAHLVDSLAKLPHGGDIPIYFTCGTDKVKDVDGNEYNTVKIGNQCWMKENLRTTKKPNGAAIAEGVYAPHNDNEKVETYGRLYTWSVVMNGASSTNYPESGNKVQGICPTGWHVPSDAEWDTLTDYVHNSTNPNYKCSGCSTTEWSPSTECIAKALASKTGWNTPIFPVPPACSVGSAPENNDATGFSAVPAGNYDYGHYNDFGDRAFFWSATDNGDDIYAVARRLYIDSSNVIRDVDRRVDGFSVRCLRDAGGIIPVPVEVSCEQVMECMGDTLGKLNKKIENLKNTVDSLSKLPHGGDTTEVADGQPCPGAKTVSDGTNTYNTVKIGNQCWMAQNLRTDVDDGVYPKKNDGQDDLTPEEQVTYGRLYSWTAMMNGKASSDSVPSGVQGICPTGWHVPSDAEWDTLTHYVYNSAYPNYKCSDCTSSVWEQSTKCIANALSAATGWQSPSKCGAGYSSTTLNKTGFSAVPAGYLFVGSFFDFGSYAYFWSATQGSDVYARYRKLDSNVSSVFRYYDSKDHGYSVRCLKDY